MIDDDSSDFDGPATGDDIADAARSMLGDSTYQLYNYNDGVPSGEPKDHQFVSNVLSKAGLGFDGAIDTHPTADDWANPNSNIPGFSPVQGPPQAGDILATQKPIQTDWYYGGGQQMGIATDSNSSIGITNNMRIGESDFGLKDGHDPTIWRADQAADSGSSVSAMGMDETPEQQQDSDKWRERTGIAGGIIGGAIGLSRGGIKGLVGGYKSGSEFGEGLYDNRGRIKDALDQDGAYYSKLDPGNF